MYPDPSPTTSVDIAHENSLPVVDQAAARPCRCTPASAPTKTVGYARCGLEPADVRAAVAELHELGVDSEYIFLDQPDEDPDDGLQLALQALQAGDTLMVARLARLGRSLGRIARIADQIAALDAQLAVGGELLVGMAPERLLRMAAAAQIDMLHQGLDDVSFQRWPRLNDQRHSYHQGRRRPNGVAAAALRRRHAAHAAGETVRGEPRHRVPHRQRNSEHPRVGPGGGVWVPRRV